MVSSSRGGLVQGIQIAGDDATYEWQQIAWDDAKGTTIFPDRTYEMISTRSMWSGVTRALDDVDCDVVAVNGWSVTEACAGLAWRQARAGRRAVLMSETKRDDNRRFWWKEWLKRRAVARCDTALVGGRSQVDYLCELGLDRERIFTGYDVVDNAYFETGADTTRNHDIDLRRKYQLPDRYFLACTRFLSRKNVDGLLRAYKCYRESCESPPWGLVILGSGEQASGLRQLERDLQLDGVVWPGFVQYDELPVYYGLASAFVHPAKSEPWGLVVNEAAASALPLLVSRTVGARYELVEDGENGYLFDPFDTAAMTYSLTKMSELDETSRRQMGACSRTNAARWSPRRFGEQLWAAAELAFSLPDR